MFSTPKSSVQHVPSHAPISDTPFIPPSARLTGPVEFPAKGEVDKQQDGNTVQRDVKEQKKSRKSRKDTKDDKRSKKRQVSPSPDVGTLHAKSVPVPVIPPVQAQVTSGPEVVPKQKSKPAPLSTVASDPEQSELFLPGTTGPSFAQPGPVKFPQLFKHHLSLGIPLFLMLTGLHRSWIPWTLTLLILKPAIPRIRCMMKVKYPLIPWTDLNRQKI